MIASWDRFFLFTAWHLFLFFGGAFLPRPFIPGSCFPGAYFLTRRLTFLRLRGASLFPGGVQRLHKLVLPHKLGSQILAGGSIISETLQSFAQSLRGLSKLNEGHEVYANTHEICRSSTKN